MIRLALKPRRFRRKLAVPLALAGVLATSELAYACLETCIDTYGSVFQVGQNEFWELQSCEQYYNAGGGVTTKCYYKVTNFEQT